MKFALSVFSALALASTALGADLEDRSFRYYPAPNRAAQQQANVRTVTVHDTMMATTTATQFVTVTAGAQCTLEGNAAPSPAVTTTTTHAASADAETTTTTTNTAAATTVTSAPALETTSVAAQERPTTTVETVTSTHTYSTTVVYATPTTVTQMEHDSTVVRTVDVTRTSTRRVVETQVVTLTKTKFVRETVTRTRQAQETGRGNHHNNGNNNNNHNGQATVGRDTTTTAATTDATTTTATADATTTAAAETETTTTATESTTSANAEETTTSTSVAATIADATTTTTTGNVATVTDFETSTFLVTTTVDGVVSTETGTTTVAVGTTTDEASTTQATASATQVTASTTASESSSTSDVAATIADTSSASATASVSDVTGSVAATSTSSADGANNTEDPQTSLTLDPRVIEDGFASDGQNPPVAGQVPSLTSTNNYINFCLTQNVPLTDGKQIREGSCNVVPQGRIIAKDRIPSAKFVFPLNFGTIPANQPFTAKLKVKNLQAGSFTNAQLTYYSAPAQVNDQGILIGHSHLVIEQLRSLDDTEPLDPTKFAFFKGLNAPLDGDSTLSATLDRGLPAGAYRMFSINTAANHQPALASVAQHGSMDDGVYFTAV